MQVNTIRIYNNRKLFLISLFTVMLSLILIYNLPAQLFEDLDEELADDYTLRGEQKSATRAIIFSSIFPGGGHIYANPGSVGTYLFPLLEIGFWVGYFYFNSEGDRIEREYESFADEHYCRERFRIASNHLINMENVSSIYNEDHFRLDQENTQHFYEDIGKYNKYIFGWYDWFNDYVHPETEEIRWAINPDNGLWLGNYPIDADDDATYDRPYSKLRAEYIQMRHDAQENYDISYLMSFGFALNRIASALDAVRVTNRYNRELRYSYDFNIRLQPQYVNNNVTPTLNLAVSFR